MSTIETLINVYPVFEILQFNFNEDICVDIFGLNRADHMFNKWLECDKNIIMFMNRMDCTNKEKMMSWGLFQLNKQNNSFFK
jgi:hypothetical protein